MHDYTYVVTVFAAPVLEYVGNNAHNMMLYLIKPGTKGRHAPGFLKLILCGSSVYVCVCVCPRPRLLITSGVMWGDMNLIQLVKQVLHLLCGNDSRYH